MMTISIVTSKLNDDEHDGDNVSATHFGVCAWNNNGETLLYAHRVCEGRPIDMTLKHTMAIAAVFVTFGVGAAQAQGVPRGAAEGAAAGDAAAGPVGAAVGGVVGGVAGGIAGILGVDTRPRFHEYVVREHHPSYHYAGDVRVGIVLPPGQIEYYEVPAEYGVRGYQYTIIDDHAVLVDPRTRRIVEVVD